MLLLAQLLLQSCGNRKLLKRFAQVFAQIMS